MAIKKPKHEEIVVKLWQIEAKKNERANALKEVKRVYKEFGFIAGMKAR